MTSPAPFPGGRRLEIAGESLWLMPHRALYWPERSAVLIADTHFGKAATFRSHGIPIGDDSLNADLDRLTDLVTQTAARRLVILGDLLHARRGRSPETLERVTGWRRRHPELSIELIVGNHDRAAGPPLREWEIAVRPADVHEAPFVYRHHPTSSPQGFVLAGHLHPKVVLRFDAKGQVKLPCFWLRPEFAVLPAFGSFIDSAAIKPAAGDALYAIAEDAVHDVTRLATV